METGIRSSDLRNVLWCSVLLFSLLFDPTACAFGQSPRLVLQGGKVNEESTWGSVLALLPDQESLVTLNENELQVWDIEKKTLKHRFVDSLNGGGRFAFRPDGKQIVHFSADEKTRRSGLVCHSLIDGSISWQSPFWPPSNISASPDGLLLALCNERERRIEILDMHSGKELGLLYTDSKIRSFSQVVFSPSGRLLIPITNESTLLVWDLELGGLSVHKIAFPNRNTRISQIDFLNENEILVGGRMFNRPNWTPVLQVRNIETGKVVHDFADVLEEIPDFNSYRLAENQKILVTAHKKILVVWDFQGRRKLREITIPSNNPGRTVVGRNGMVISPNGRSLYVSFGNSTYQWDLQSGKLLTEPEQKHQGPIRSIAVNTDGSLVATGGYDGVVYLWDGETGKQLSQLKSCNLQINSVAFLPHTRRLVVAGDYSKERRISGFVCTVDVESGASSREVDLFAQQQAIIASSDGKQILATASASPKNDDPFGGGGDMYSGAFSAAGSRILAFESSDLKEIKAVETTNFGFGSQLLQSADGTRLGPTWARRNDVL